MLSLLFRTHVVDPHSHRHWFALDNMLFRRVFFIDNDIGLHISSNHNQQQRNKNPAHTTS